MRAIDADALEKEGWSLHRTIRVDMNTEEYQTKPLKQVPTIEPNHIEYTESEMKILELMFRIIDETIKMQNGYMDIDYVSFDGGDLYNLANKLGVEDY